MKQRCLNCKWWSDIMARSTPNGLVEAMCLCAESPRNHQYTIQVDRCEAFEDGEPVDMGGGL